MNARVATTIAAAALLAAPLLTLPATSAAADTPLTGRWVLNEELTADAQPKPSTRSRSSRGPQASVVVGGMPIPSSGGGLPTVAGNPQDPKVLRTTEFTVAPAGDDLRLSFAGVGDETLKRGNDQGLVSRWSARRLNTSYETTSRRVSQVYQVRRDGRMEVTVTLRPNQGARTVYKRIFDRAD
jgi:hypothetical protein